MGGGGGVEVYGEEIDRVWLVNEGEGEWEGLKRGEAPAM